MSFLKDNPILQNHAPPILSTKSKSDGGQPPSSPVRPRLTVNFHENISDFHGGVDFDLRFNMTDVIGRENSFVSFEGTHAKTFLLIGFLMIKRAFMQEDHSKGKVELNVILNSFISLQRYLNYTDVNNNLAVSKNILEDLFDKAQGPKKVIKIEKDPNMILRLLCSQSQADHALLHSIAQAGRSLMAQYLASKKDQYEMSIFSKVTTLRDWALDDGYSEDLLKLLAEAFGFRIEFTSNIRGKKAFTGQRETKETVHLLHHYSKGSNSLFLISKLENKQISAVSEILQLDPRYFVDEARPPEMQQAQIPNMKLQTCSICKHEIPSGLVYTNKECGHNYCSYCIGELKLTDASDCVINGCVGHIDRGEIIQFLADDSQENNMKKVIDNNQAEEIDIVPPQMNQFQVRKRPTKTVQCPLCENTMHVNVDVYYTICEKCGGPISIKKAELNQLMAKQIFMCPKSFDLLKTCDILNIKYCNTCSTAYCRDCAELIKDGECHCPVKDVNTGQRELNIQQFLKNPESFALQKLSASANKSDQLPNMNKTFGSNNLAISNPVPSSVNKSDHPQAAANKPNEYNKQQEENKIQEKSGKPLKQKSDIGDEIICSYCTDYIYRCVTAWPCMHNFCSACFHDFMRKFDKCPLCDRGIQGVNRSVTITNIIEKYLDNNPEKRRSKEEYDEMDKKDRVIQDMLDGKRGSGLLGLKDLM